MSPARSCVENDRIRRRQLPATARQTPRRGDGAVTRELPIVNRKGLHARATAKFVHCVEQFDAEVTVSRCGETVGGTVDHGHFDARRRHRHDDHRRRDGRRRRRRRWTPSRRWSPIASARTNRRALLAAQFSTTCAINQFNSTSLRLRAAETRSIAKGGQTFLLMFCTNSKPPAQTYNITNEICYYDRDEMDAAIGTNNIAKSATHLVC